MKDYLSKDERDDVLTAYVGNSAMEWLLKRSEKHMSSLEKKYLKTAITFFNKFTEALGCRIKPSEFEKISREFIGAKVYLKRELPSKKEGEANLTEEDVHSLASPIMELYCKGCDYTGQVAAECSVGMVFRKAGVPLYTDEPCPPPVKVHELIPDGTNKRYRHILAYKGTCPYRLEE